MFIIKICPPIVVILVLIVNLTCPVKSQKPNLYLSYTVRLVESKGYTIVTTIVTETKSDKGAIFSMHVVQLLDVIDCYNIVKSDSSGTKMFDEQLKNKKALM